MGEGFVMLRRRIALLLAVLLLCLTCPALAYEQKTAELHYDSISIRLDGKYLTPLDANGNEVNPFIIDGTTYLPIRAVASALGLKVDWEQETQTIRLTSGAKAQTGGHRNGSFEDSVEAVLKYPGITILLDGKKVYPKDVNGKTVDPFVIDGTTYLPIRAVASALGLKVQWEKETKTVLLYSGKTQAAAGPHPEHAAYEAVLDEYREFLTTPFGKMMDEHREMDSDWVTERFPHVDEASWMHCFVRGGAENQPDWTFAELGDPELEYAFFDINGDGTDELLFSRYKLQTIYAWNGSEAVFLLTELGESKCFTTIHEDGMISLFWVGGSGDETRYRITADGFTAEQVERIELTAETKDDTVQAAYDEEPDIPWTPLFAEG